MGDNLKLSKEKRHRSSSSIAGSNVKNTCSERKVNIKVSIPEVDDQFVLAEARCDELKEKLEFVKNLKRKRKLKKRSGVAVLESTDAAPFISVQTQPKTRLQSSGRSRCGDTPSPQPQYNKQAYAHVAAPKQATDYGRMRAPLYDNYTQDEIPQYDVPSVRLKKKNMSRQSVMDTEKVKAMCEEGDGTRKNAANHGVPQRLNIRVKPSKVVHNKSNEGQQVKPPAPPLSRRKNSARESRDVEGHGQPEDRPVVELFYKNCSGANDLQADSKNCVTDGATYGGGENESSTKERGSHRRRLKYRSRGYELPTVASQMKQAGVRFYNNDYGCIPFIISKSCAPSHNIAVNIQQVLNGFKNQQPLKGIPLTMAFHMGLGHLPDDGVRGDGQPLLENRGMNAIRFGRHVLRLPDKLVSYNRLLSLYREGNGVVSRFLRAINRPHRFYTSMYNLATREEGGAAISGTKATGQSEEARRNLALYAGLYRKFQLVERNLKENPNNPELLDRKQELIRELAEREDYIRQNVLQDHSEFAPTTTNIRATASTADDPYHHFSNNKSNLTVKI